jgi:glucokinase
MLLAGDIGGTKTDLAIFPTAGDLVPVAQATFRSANYASLEAIVQEFLSGTEIAVDKAVFGVAGPVAQGKSQVTNLPWHISEDRLRAVLSGPKVKLLNDLAAIAYAVPHLTHQDLEPLNREQMDTDLGQNIAVIAPGTGLGQATLVFLNETYHVIASEGGHTDFAPTTLFEIELLKYLLGKYNHVSYERVCSGGLGIPNIYTYLKENNYALESPQIAAALQSTDDPTPLIVQAALKENCELCSQTLNTFVAILGSEAGNLALTVMATGGVYLGGGIPPKILPKLKDGTFMAAFVKKGRFSDTLSRIPVYVIVAKQPALMGAVQYGLRF